MEGHVLDRGFVQTPVMIQKYLIRLATPLDSRIIADLYLKSRKKFLPFAPLIHSDAEIYSWMRDTLIPKTQVFIVEQNANIVGMMSIDKKDKINWIEHLYVSHDATGQGIGSLLMAKAKDLNCPIRLRTFQDNLIARHFYEKHGFKILEFSDGSENEENCPDMVYEYRF